MIQFFGWCFVISAGVIGAWIAIFQYYEWKYKRAQAKQEQAFRALMIRLETHDVDRESSITARLARDAQNDAMRVRGLGVTDGYGDSA